MSDIATWLEAMRLASQLKVREIDLARCRSWSIRDDAIVHDSGRFFAIRRLRTRSHDPAWHDRALTMIDQSEVGWLGFVVRPGAEGGVEWLLQAKTEPGNVGGTQVAPTVQATRSNYMRVHGGRPTRFLDLMAEQKDFVSDGVHSEQGSRFLWKFNRNSVRVVPRAFDAGPQDGPWRWWPSRALREALGRSFAVNTDARSVIASTDWSLVAAGHALFNAPALKASYRQRWTGTPFRHLLRNAGTRQRVGWSFERLDRAFLGPPKGEAAGVVFAEVMVADREVPRWCQPFLATAAPAECVLLMRIGKDGAEVLLRPRREVGFGDRAEFGPSSQTGDGSLPDEAVTGLKAVELAAIDQSDEGGRFYHSVVRYRVMLLTGDRDDAKGDLWLSLGALEQLVREPTTTTNELRTLVSLLLSSRVDAAVAAL